ncbi:MAG: InlB B-repeat-containing protein, partial [Finegoldia magna]|nr:InlB B-repeat-containing protein [Finegoldia magna]
VNVKAKVTFTNGKDPQELDIPITVYKNVYEALNKAGDKPLFLKEAEGKEAKDGGLKDILKDNTENRYIKVTIKPNKDFKNKDDKVYYVNPNAWVEIPELKVEDSEAAGTGFINWTADKAAQNEKQEKNGIFKFDKRHKFTEDTIITPVDAKDVVEQTDPNKKPDVPKSYVKVIVKTTDKATDKTAFEKTFWVNPTKEVTIDVTNPIGKTVAADTTKPGTVGYTMNFSKWETEDKAKTWEDKIVGKFEKETTIIAKYSVTPEKIKDQVPSSDTVHTPQGKTPTVDEIKGKITPPEGKTISKVTIVKDPDVNTPGDSKVQVIVEYTDGSSIGTNEKPIEIPVKVHEPIVKSNPDGSKPKDAMDNYVKVIFKAGTGGTVSGDLVYYVSPEVEVDMTNSAKAITKTPNIGYYVNGEKWTNKDNKTLKDTFKDPETEFVFNFDKSKDIVEKTDDNVKKPDGYVEVIFKTEDENKGKLDGNVKEKIYYVNPNAGIKLVKLADGKTAGEKQLAVPKTAPAANYEFDKWFEEIDTENAITSERIHVAKFKLAKVTLTYEAGEGAKGEVPAKVEVDNGTTIRLSRADNLSKENAVFAGWKLDNDDKIYQPGDSVTLERARTATAQWTPTENIIPYDPQEPITRPDGYVRVTFEADEGLTLQKVKFYYVKKNSGVTLEKLAKPEYSENVGYKFKNWDKDDSLVINEDVVATALSTPIDDVIEGKPGVEKPDGYVEVKFVAGENGTVAKTTYYVNPNKYVTLTPPTTKPNTGFEFGGWSQNAEIPTQYTEELTT